MAAIWDLGPKRGFAMGGFGLWHSSNEYISGEKALLIFLSNLTRYLLGLHGSLILLRTLVRKCEQHKTSKSGVSTSRTGYTNQKGGIFVYKNVKCGVIYYLVTENGISWSWK